MNSYFIFVAFFKIPDFGLLVLVISYACFGFLEVLILPRRLFVQVFAVRFCALGQHF
jgi:hypothetical protein